MKILLFSEIDPLYSQVNRLHWFLRALKGHEITLIALRDTSKTRQVFTQEEFPTIYLNRDGESPKKCDAFPSIYINRFLKEYKGGTWDVLFSYDGLRLSAQLAQRLKLPFVYDLCDDLAHMVSTTPHLPPIARPIAYLVAKFYTWRNISLANRVVSTHHTLFDEYSRDTAKYSYIPNGYAWEESTDCSTYTLPEKQQDEKRILYIGTLREFFDIQGVVEESRTWPVQYRLVIVGEEGASEELKSQLKQLNDDGKIHWLPYVPHGCLPEVMKTCDVGIIPYKMTPTANKAFPLKLVEYASQGLRIVSTPVRIVSEVFGEITTMKDPAETWLQAIERSMIHPETSEKITAFVAPYTWDRIGEDLNSILEEVLNESNKK